MARAASSVIVALFMSRSSRWTKTVGQYGILRSEIRSEPKVWFGSRHKVAAIGIGGSLAAPPLPHHRSARFRTSTMSCRPRTSVWLWQSHWRAEAGKASLVPELLLERACEAGVGHGPKAAPA